MCVFLSYINCELLDLYSSGVKSDPSKASNLKLEIQYKINGDYTNDLAMLTTIGTLGIFPYFHTIESDIKF